MTATLFLALAITIIVEGCIAAAILRRFVWIESAAIQCLTWPIAQTLFWRGRSLWIIELGVALAELALWRLAVAGTWKRAALVSAAANGATTMIAWMVIAAQHAAE